jgi:hypothetical protein
MGAPDGGTNDVLTVASATTLVPAARDSAFDAVERTLHQLWPSRARVLHRDAPHTLVHAVSDEPHGEPDVWLSWTVEEAGCQATRVTVSLSEQGSAAPPAALDALLMTVVSYAGAHA